MTTTMSMALPSRKLAPGEVALMQALQFQTYKILNSKEVRFSFSILPNMCGVLKPPRNCH